ncbi:cytochrome P450 family protein [Nonomuraea jabiensis]|uniref:hypothetical protein n=1 Tax=Nonomuraea jabiensis TaxID=882448 RepID=UPI00368C5F83
MAVQQHEALLRLTGGHPLALSMAAKLATEHGQEPPGDWQPVSDVLRHLLDRLIGEVPTPAHRRALEVCAHVLDITQALLQAAAPGQAEELFAWLRDQPYIVAGRHGLHPHDLVRRLLNADLRWRDPDGYQEMHTRVRAHLIERARAASGPAVLPAALAPSYLHRHNGFVSRFITWRDAGRVHEDVLRPGDQAAVLRLIRQAEGPHSAAVAGFWLDRQPSAFRIYARFATEDLLLGGHRIRRGETVTVALASASRAAGPAEAADRLDVTRPDARHLAFGHGIHYCLGAPLARLEGAIALRVLLHRLPDLAWADPSAQRHWLPAGITRGPVTLPVRFTPADVTTLR